MKRYILNQLAFCYKKAGRSGFIDFLNKEVRQNLSQNDLFYALTVELENSFLIKERNYDKILENLDFLSVNFSGNDQLYKNTLLALIHFKLGYSNDLSSANSYLEELKSKYPDDELTFHAMLYLGETDDLPWSNDFIPKQDESSLATIPDKFDLLGNYPNPFNPSTRITYALPYQSSVELVIYDLVGREIKSFNIPSQSSGYQNIIWDGGNENGVQVSSGVYLYRISIKSLENHETFIKTAKLMMLK